MSRQFGGAVAGVVGATEEDESDETQAQAVAGTGDKYKFLNVDERNGMASLALAVNMMDMIDKDNNQYTVPEVDASDKEQKEKNFKELGNKLHELYCKLKAGAEEGSEAALAELAEEIVKLITPEDVKNAPINFENTLKGAKLTDENVEEPDVKKIIFFVELFTQIMHNRLPKTDKKEVVKGFLLTLKSKFTSGLDDWDNITRKVVEREFKDNTPVPTS